MSSILKRLSSYSLFIHPQKETRALRAAQRTLDNSIRHLEDYSPQSLKDNDDDDFDDDDDVDELQGSIQLARLALQHFDNVSTMYHVNSI